MIIKLKRHTNKTRNEGLPIPVATSCRTKPVTSDVHEDIQQPNGVVKNCNTLKSSNYMSHRPPGFETLRDKMLKTVHEWRINTKNEKLEIER